MVLDPTQAPAQQKAPNHVTAVILDFLERAGWSAGQAFFAILLAGGTVVSVASLPWKYASVVALGAAVASVVLTAIQYWTKLQDYLSHRNLPPVAMFWVDLGVRLVKTFLASLAGAFAAAHPFNILNFNWGTALNVAFLAMLGALAKGLLARGSDTGLIAKPAAEAMAAPNPSTLPTSTYLEAVKG